MSLPVCRACFNGSTRRILVPKAIGHVAARRRASGIASRQWSTPLAKGLAGAITTAGPISVASYMRQCLTSSDGGYYTSPHTPDSDQFGKGGDFVTSPEISQVFGELVGVWIVAEWMAQGKSSDGIHLIELGPGRGTLMDDVLRTIRNFKDMASSVEAIYLVEASEHLQAKQHSLLCGDAPLEMTDAGRRSSCKRLPRVPVIWAEDLKMVPQNPTKTPFVIAHEFFDALPIHVFQSIPMTESPQLPASLTRSVHDLEATAKATPQPRSIKNEWRELVVTPTSPFASPSPPPASPQPDFELSVSKIPTPHSMLLPHSSSRYAALLPTAGSTIEISPESLSTVSNIATRIGGGNPQSSSAPNKASRTASLGAPPKAKPSGAALILDYGPSTTIPANSLRGIRQHARCSPFHSPGLVDVSADVDFGALAEAAIAASPGVEVHGPVEQAVWLRAMGIEARAEALKAAATGEPRKQKADAIDGAWKRLVDRGPGGMGRTYKALAILPHRQHEARARRKPRRPVGFGGDVQL